MYLLVTARKGISSMQLAKEIGITQKSAWFVLHRLREACGGKDLSKLKGIIEIDETFVGGIEKNKHESKSESRSRNCRQDCGSWSTRSPRRIRSSMSTASLWRSGGMSVLIGLPIISSAA
jgi:hypothetical protein